VCKVWCSGALLLNSSPQAEAEALDMVEGLAQDMAEVLDMVEALDTNMVEALAENICHFSYRRC
jgi:hypothetical protein